MNHQSTHAKWYVNYQPLASTCAASSISCSYQNLLKKLHVITVIIHLTSSALFSSVLRRSWLGTHFYSRYPANRLSGYLKTEDWLITMGSVLTGPKSSSTRRINSYTPRKSGSTCRISSLTRRSSGFTVLKLYPAILYRCTVRLDRYPAWLDGYPGIGHHKQCLLTQPDCRHSKKFPILLFLKIFSVMAYTQYTVYRPTLPGWSSPHGGLHGLHGYCWVWKHATWRFPAHFLPV